MPSHTAQRYITTYFQLLIIAIALLLSSSCSNSEPQVSWAVKASQDSIIPSRVTFIADLPDSLQPKTIRIESTPALTVRILKQPGTFRIKSRLEEQIVTHEPEKTIKNSYSPILQNFTAEDGLAQDVISSGYADKKGNLWFGTPVGGVTRYDGKSFTTYTTSNGLVNNTVDAILEDKTGVMWFGTDNGISRFDGNAFATFGNFKKVLCLMEDMERNIWIGTNDHGLFKYTWDSIIQFSAADGFFGKGAKTIKQDQHGTIWIGAWTGLYKFESNKFTRQTDSLEINSLCLSKDGTAWVNTLKGIYKYTAQMPDLVHSGSRGGIRKFKNLESIIPNDVWNAGVYADQHDNIWYENEKDGIFYFNANSPNVVHSFNISPYGKLRTILEDNAGNMWIGTSSNGVLKYSGQAFQKLTAGSIRTILEDHHGDIWFAGYEGHISRFDGDHIKRFGPNLAFWSMSRDNVGNIWIGTEVNGLIQYDHTSFTFYTDMNGLPSNFIASITPDNRGNLWIGTMEGLSKFDGNSFTNYSKKQGLAGNKVWCILEDQTNALYIGTDEGLSLFDSTHNEISNYTISQNHQENDIRSIIKDSTGNLWLATYGGGLYRYDGKTFYHYTTEQGLPNNVVTQMALTKEGYIVIGTNNGIAILTGFKAIEKNTDHETPTHQIYPVQNTLSNDKLSSYAPVFEIYNSYTGYPVMDVNRGHHAIHVDSKGIIWIACGSAKSGLMRFDYSSLNKNNDPPLSNITGIKVNNELVCWNNLLDTTQKNRSSPSNFQPVVYAFVNEEITTFGKTLPDSVRISMKKKYKGIEFDAVTPFYPVPVNLVLPYRHNRITIEFAAIETGKPSLVQYQYKLEGYDQNWSTPSNITSATFGNIYEGTYDFQLKARSPSGIWSVPLKYTFTVLPPWWRTWWALTLYLLLIVGLIYEIVNFFKRRLLLQHQLKTEQLEANRLKELDTFKSQLFTNLTHEFRTPLTVILGMAKQLATGSWQSTVASIEKARIARGLELIENNGKSLLQLINQLLDLSKLENKSFRLQNIQSDIVPYLRYVTESFQSYAEDKHLSLSFISDVDLVVMDFDPEQIKQVITNLISNAVKFTPAAGEVTVKLFSSGDVLEVVVTDTGIGISSDDLPHILDRFYQVDSSSTRVAQGTGIGLAHTQELLKIMGGSISVASELGKGTSVKVRLPIKHVEKVMPSDETAETFKPQLSPHYRQAKTITDDTLPQHQPSSSDESIARVLIIEDNADVVEYLTSCLEPAYQIHVGSDGKKGVDIALEVTPDLIISDVMMPEMDGFQVCNRLKNDERTSHIPIILLTAKADAASRLVGLRRGADAYMAKPFSPEELFLQISTLLENRRRMAAYFSRGLRDNTLTSDVELSAPEAIQIENAFMKKVNAIIELHYANEVFSLPQLCSELSMSRSQLFRKMKAVADISPSDLIRSYRLRKAKTLLEQGDVTVAEVTYQVGFKDPSYFTKLFQEEFGVIPSSVSKP